MKTLLSGLLIIAVLSMLLGCTQQPPPVTQTPSQAPVATTSTTTSTPTTAAPSPTYAPVTIRYGTNLAPNTAPMVGQMWWAEEVTKRTEGRVKVDMYPANSLVDGTQGYEAVLAGVADMYFISTSLDRKRFPITTIPAIPGAGFPDDTLEANTAHTDTFFELLDKFPAAAAEYEQFAPMFFYIVYSQSYIISKNKKITVPTDLKGMKVGSSGLRMDFVSKLGSAPVTDMPPTAYEKLQTGVTDASFVAVSAAKDFKIYEVTNYILDVPFGGGGMPVIMNKATWNKISPQDQQLMKELAVEGSRQSNAAIADNTRDAWQLLTDKGMKVTPTAEERALWDKEFAVLWEEYIQQNEAAGVTNAREIFNFWKSAADKAWGN